MPAKQSDGELIAACRKGESWAWEALVERYKRLVYSIPLRAGLAPEDAADVFQTVFVQLLEHLRTIREPQGLAAWLITTAKRCSWRSLHERQREPAAEDFGSLAEEWLLGAHPDESLWADQALVREALELVGERCKELLRLLYFDPAAPSYEAISRRLKMPPGSVGPTRARCLHKMREILHTMGMV